MDGEREINITTWKVAINELYKISQEMTINELYQLFLACKKRETQEVSKLVQQLKKRDVKFNLIVGNGTTTLHEMCFEGNLGMVKLLIEMYGSVKAKDENQRTPLHLACQQGHLEIAQYLHYEHGCILQCEDTDGPNPTPELLKLFQRISQLYLLFTACKRKDLRLVIESNSQLCGMNLNFVLKSENCFTSLHLMCELGVLDMVKSVTEMYGNVEARDENGQTPLHIACENGHINVAEHLIYECGCDKEARDNRQNTPLLTACLEGQTDTVKFLLTKFRCKLDIRDINGRTILHTACFIGYQELVQYLINDCGCSPEVTGGKSQGTSLHFACSGGHLEVVKYLADKCKCNIEARDNLNYTPLYLASLPLASSSTSGKSINTEVVSYLISQGCDPEAEALDGGSPIQNFYYCGELSMIKYCTKFKKHNPKTWKYRMRPSQILHMLNKQPDSFHPMQQTQSSTIISKSPLEVACSKYGSLDVVKFLVEEYGLDPLERTEITGSDSTHQALQVFDYAKDRLNLPLITENIKAPLDTITAMTPLTKACCSARLDLLQYLVSKCGQAVAYYCSELLVIACRFGHSEIVKYLLNLKYSNPDIESERGNTLLHFATLAINLKGACETVKLLIEFASMNKSNIDRRNYLGETALHTACKIHPCRPDIIDILLSSGCNSQISNYAGNTPLWVTKSPEVFRIFMGYSPGDVCERILSDDIGEEQCLELLQCLLQHNSWNPNNRTKNGNTALHLACKANRFTAVKYLFSSSNFKYDPYARNKRNQTPIELTSSMEIIRELIKYGSNPIDILMNSVIDEEKILQIVKEINEDKLNGITINSNTALHLACLTDRATIVRYLLRESKIDINAKNVSDISPIQLTKNSEIIIELIRHGANPTDLYNYCRRVLGESKLLQTTVKVFVLGDSNAGKSTLISSLKKEGWFNFFASWISTSTASTSTVVDNAESGHGIIVHDFKSKHCGQMVLHDFVGKRLFHESQSDFLRETAHSPRVFLIAINLSGSAEEIISNLRYWLGFLEEMPSSDSKLRNHTIIVGSHVDKCRNDEIRVKIRNFLQKRVNNLSNNMDYHDFIALDCRSHSSSDFTKLRRCLAKLCVIARNPKSLAFNAHCLQVYILDRFEEKVAVPVHDILNKMKGEEDVDENDPLNFLPQSDFQLQNLCVELHTKGQILYLRDSTVSETDFQNSNRWLIIKKAALISHFFEIFESTITSLPSNNGILSFSTISDLEPFKAYNPDMFVRFLCHLECCKEILDPETLQAITNSASMRLTSERCFFFPALIENSAPEGIWDDRTDSFSYHCGWILQCTKPEQFFTSNFLQTLILRAMFCNTYLGPTGTSVPALQNCSLWKGGIFWSNIFGAESLVEVLPNNKAVLFLMRCRDDNLAKCMEHRSTIIHQIRKCVKEFCGKLITRESLIVPSLVKKYPICSTPSSLLFDIGPLAFAIVNITSVEQPYASSLDGTSTIPIRELLKFEPYYELSALTIQEICNNNNPRYISRLTGDFLVRFAQQVRKNPLFIKMITRIINDHGIMDSSDDNLLSKLTEWRDTCQITYQQLHKCIERFSIFAGLNILDMVPGLAFEEFRTPPSSPVLKFKTGTLRKISTTADSVNSKSATASPKDLCDTSLQLGDKPKLQDLDLLKLRDGSEMRIIERVAEKWEKLAIRFGFGGARINNIKREAFFKPEDACLIMFTRWLDGEHDLKPPTWYNLIQCLEETNKFQSLLRDAKEAIMLKTDDTPQLHQLYLLKPGDGSEVKIIKTVADQWIILARSLGFDKATCESLMISATDKVPDVACKEMFTCWFKGGQNLRPATWDCLIRSLEDSGFTELAKNVKKVLLV